MLPGEEYATADGKYRKLLRENVAYILDYERNQSEPSAYGTAPWRVLQFYDLSVSALKQNDATKALFYLGLLSHYLGDLAEPLNTTLNFDGRHYPMPANASSWHLRKRSLKRYRSQATVYKETVYAMGPRGLEGLTRQRILPELLRLVDSGHPFIDPF
jgi:hypothetical protein